MPNLFINHFTTSNLNNQCCDSLKSVPTYNNWVYVETKYLIIPQLRQQFRLMLSNQGLNNLFQSALHDVIQFIQG